MKGYAGKILHVDLSEKRFRVEEPGEDFYRACLGGSTLGAYYVLKGMDPKADALSAENVLVFSIGPVTGAVMSGTARHCVTTKSPQSNGIAASEAGGYWGPEFRKAGFDAVVITGESEKPVYLWIHDGKYELRDASALWGKVTKEAQQLIRKELEDPKVKVAQIGPAGENKVRYANIVNELAHFNGRNGMGAVMGAKKLRAIAVRGTLKPEFDDKAWLQEMAKRGAARVKNEEGYQGFREYGTNNCVDEHISYGGLPTKNWSSGVFEGQDKMTAKSWRDSVIKPGTCFGCAQSCKRHVDPERTKAADAAYGGPEYETVGICGSNLGISDHEMICRINEKCAMYAMDTISFGGTASFLMECLEKGVISREQTDGLDLCFGDGEEVLKLADKVAFREGFGDKAAEGSRRLSNFLGEQTKDYLVEAKGKEFPAHMPRRKASLGLAYALVPFGADHVSSQMDPTIENEPLPYQMTQLGFDRAEPSDEMNSEKAKLFWRTQIAYSSCDTASVCLLAFGLWTIYDLDDLVDAINHATGWKMNMNEFLMIGEKRLQMMRVFNIRAGLTVADDVLPEKMFKPLTGGMSEGKVLDKNEFVKARELYYDFMGWDKESGMPLPSKLMEMNLEWLLDPQMVKTAG